MDAFGVVVLEPGGKGGLALSAAGEYLVVGPFGLQGAVEALSLAVGSGAARFDEPLNGTEILDGLL